MFVIGTSNENHYLHVRKSKKFWHKTFLLSWRVNNDFHQKFQLQTSFRMTRSTKKIMMSMEYFDFWEKSVFVMGSENRQNSSYLLFCGCLNTLVCCFFFFIDECFFFFTRKELIFVKIYNCFLILFWMFFPKFLSPMSPAEKTKVFSFNKI